MRLQEPRLWTRQRAKRSASCAPTLLFFSFFSNIFARSQAPSLLCSACDKLSDAVGSDDALITECRGCCTEEVNGTGGTYAKATLDICR